MSGEFSQNIGDNETLVLDSSSVLLTSDGSGLFDITIDLYDLFFYDGTENLLLDITLFNNPSTSLFDAVGFPFIKGPAPMATISAKDANAISADQQVDFAGLVTQFTFLEPIPEPSTLILFATGLAGLVFIMRRRRPLPMRPTGRL